jgi:tetrahydromethanopterin S-methyltransferase subunit G
MLMAVMMSPRENWTDERLDDLNKKVDNGFARVDTDIRELRQEMNARFDAMNRNFLGGLITVLVAVIGSNAF